jgi:hypothetical protein
MIIGGPDEIHTGAKWDRKSWPALRLGQSEILEDRRGAFFKVSSVGVDGSLSAFSTLAPPWPDRTENG